MPASELTCPSCSKANTTAPCQRCGCDLAPLFAIRREADSSLEAAAQHLRNGDARDALDNAWRSWSLKRSAEAAHVACLASIALGDMDELEEWRNRAHE